jgi:uncharacterized membrane protein
MNNPAATFLRGLGVVLPLGLTIWLVVWAAASAEALLHEVFVFVLPERYYVPGLGVALGILLIYATGVLVQAFLIGQLWGWIERLLERIPLVKTVYNALRDLLGFFSNQATEGSSRVVAVQVGNGTSLIGFVTADPPRLGAGLDGDLISVYLPMSYQVGGYTALVPRDRVTDLVIPAEEAMRLVLTAGIAGPRRP